MKPYRLYGTEFSYYTGKVRPYLIYKGIEFKEVFASAWQFARVIQRKTGVQFIPVLEMPNGEVIQETSVIIDTLEGIHTDRAITPESPAQQLANALLEVYFDEWMMLPAMYYRWAFPEDNLDFLYGEFGKIAIPQAPAFIRKPLGKKIAQRFSGYLPKLGIAGEVTQEIEQQFESFLDLFSEHLKTHEFLFGERASMADFALMGPLQAHLYRDPYPGKIIRQRAPLVAAWIERMTQPHATIGDWMPNDEVPEFVMSLLHRCFKDHMPVLRDTANKITEWASENKEVAKVPGHLGGHEFTLGQANGSRIVLPAVQWMLQRPHSLYQQASGDDRQAMDQLLSQVAQSAGSASVELFTDSIDTPIERRHNRLYVCGR